MTPADAVEREMALIVRRSNGYRRSPVMRRKQWLKVLVYMRLGFWHVSAAITKE